MSSVRRGSASLAYVMVTVGLFIAAAGIVPGETDGVSRGFHDHGLSLSTTLGIGFSSIQKGGTSALGELAAVATQADDTGREGRCTCVWSKSLVVSSVCGSICEVPLVRGAVTWRRQRGRSMTWRR